MNVFLDLEETVIDSWNSGLLINVQKLKDFLNEQKVKEVRIFSFAIWDEADQRDFAARLLDPIERALGVGVLSCPSVAELLRVEKEFTSTFFDSLTDFISLRGKTGAFRTWCEAMHPGEVSVLIDDVVPNACWINSDTGTDLKFVNVNTGL